MARLRSALPDALALCGLALLTAAAACVAVPLGLAAAGICCLFVARYGTEV